MPFQNDLPEMMTEPSHDPDESYVQLSHENGRLVGEQIGISEALALEDNGPKVSRRLLDLLVLTCGGAG